MVATIHLVAGARPNFMKIAPLWHAISRLDDLRAEIVHTGQHHDPEMSDAFFQDLNLPAPHHSLQAGGRTHAEQTANVMVAYEKLCMEQRPSMTVVVGDVNSSLAAAISAKKLGIPLAHLEAGLRSGDMRMPEEVNRVLIDRISDFLWTPSADADANLLKEGIEADRISLVGNIMIDSFERLRDKIEASKPGQRLGLKELEYAVVTLHRPANVDDRSTLKNILENLIAVARQSDLPLVFPMHPRTRKRLEEFELIDLLSRNPEVIQQKPMSYIEFMGLLNGARMAITDSGGIQEETSYMGIPCLTLRENTERPITITEGTNILTSLDRFPRDFARVFQQKARNPKKIDRWDGKTSERVLDELRRRLEVEV